MSKLISAYMGIFVIFTFLGSIMTGNGGFNTTQLNGAVDDAVTEITVDDTTGFVAANDYIWVDDERIFYTGTTPTKFTGLLRGYGDTDPAEHLDNVKVYNQSSDAINSGLNYNISSTGSNSGPLAVATMVFNFMWKTIPNLVMWNFPFLTGGLVIVRYFLMSISVGLIVYIAFQFISAAQGILLR